MLAGNQQWYILELVSFGISVLASLSMAPVPWNMQADKPPKDETEEERMLRLEMEALAAEQKAQMQAVSQPMPP